MGTAFLYGNGGSGGTGATLTVTAPAGCTVTISRDGKTKTKTAGADGVAVFKGLATGEWTLTITDGGQTASKAVTVTADYATSIKFFSATINVTYPAGSTCTATDGVTTLSAPDTSGTWACVVPNAGTWTVSITNNAGTKSKSVSITSSGQHEICVLGAPSDYQEVVYLQSTGTQYLDIAFKPNAIDTYRHEFKFNAQDVYHENYLMGINDAKCRYNFGLAENQLKMGIGATPNIITAPISDNTDYNAEVAIAPSSISIELNGTSYGAASCKVVAVSSNLWLLGRNSINFSITSKSKLYYWRIYQNGTLIYDLVPCYRKADSVAGMYNVVTDTFYTNRGSGTFIVGGDV